MLASQPTTAYRFGPFEADSKTGELRKHGVKLKLQELPFRLLVSLLERPGDVVTREELQAKLWPDGTFVDFERGLGTALNKVRETLCDSAAAPRFIETIPRRGYRFIAEVERVEAEKVEVEKAGTSHAETSTPSERPARKYPVAVSIAGVLVIVLATGAAYSRFRTRPAPLTDTDVLVLADFTNSTGDPVFDGTLRDALAFQLEQSPFLRVLDDDVVRQDLQLMRRSPQERITNDLAHDICVREADKAMLAGSIASLGKSYAIELKATNCQTGATLARQQSEAADKEHVLRALATAAQGLRAKLGESLATIEKLAPPELAVTTSSLEAFQAFTTGQQLFLETRFVDAIPFLQRATELDPNLAMAYKFLASAFLNTGAGSDPQVVQEYSQKAYELRDRVSAYERFWIGSPGYLKGSSDEAEKNLELWARTYPRDPVPVVFAELGHEQRGEFEEALSLALRAHGMAPRRRLYASLVMNDYMRLDRFVEAKAVAEKHFEQGFDNPQVHQVLLQIAYLEGARGDVAKQIQWFNGRPEEYLGLEAQAANARTLGQLRLSRQLRERAADLARRRGLQDVAGRYLAPDANGDALLGNCAATRKTNPTFAAFGNSLNILAFCGDPALAQRARKRMETMSAWRGEDSLWKSAQLPQIQAAIEFGRGQPAEAIGLLQSVAQYERAFTFAVYLRGLALLELKKGADAAAEFKKIVDHRGANRGPMYPLSYVGLGRGAALAGDTAKARMAYEGFFALWKDADPDIPILIQAREEYAALPAR